MHSKSNLASLNKNIMAGLAFVTATAIIKIDNNNGIG